MSNRWQKVAAWGISLAIHLVLFVLLALTGLFVKGSAEPERIPDDITLYDAETGAGGDGERAGAAGETAAVFPAAGEMTYVAGRTVPEISETYTKQPSAQQEYKERVQALAKQAGNKNGSSAVDSKGNGNRQTGNGAGDGNGEGQGNGNGSGDRDGDSAQRPATPPRLISGSAPVYPEALRRQGVEGVVRVRIVVERDGSVQSAVIAASSGYDSMDAAAVDAVYRYRFSPARNIYEEPVRCAVGQTVQFHLQG